MHFCQRHGAARVTPRIVTFCDAAYIPVARNWLRALAEIGLDGSATIVAMDEATRKAFPPEVILHRPLQRSEGFAELWAHRIMILREMLSAGEAIIHSDADAIWLRNPMAEIEACKADMVFSQGTVWPPDVSARHGLVLCCGLFFLRPTPQVETFLDAVSVRMGTDRDDQTAINRVVASWIDGWQIEIPYEIACGKGYFTASRQPIHARGGDSPIAETGLAILPHHAFPRIVDKLTDDMFVVHPFSGKTLADKRRVLGSLGLWRA